MLEVCPKETEEELRKVKDIKSPMAQRRRRLVSLRQQQEVKEMTHNASLNGVIMFSLNWKESVKFSKLYAENI